MNETCFFTSRGSFSVAFKITSWRFLKNYYSALHIGIVIFQKECTKSGHTFLIKYRILWKIPLRNIAVGGLHVMLKKCRAHGLVVSLCNIFPDFHRIGLGSKSPLIRESTCQHSRSVENLWTAILLADIYGKWRAFALHASKKRCHSHVDGTDVATQGVSAKRHEV